MKALKNTGIISALLTLSAFAANPQVLCIFDYDLTLSSHKCPETDNKEEYHCFDYTGDNNVYNWDPRYQCLGVKAREAIARCVANGAFIGINSHAALEVGYDDKISHLIDDNHFPEFLASEHYDNPSKEWSYPKINDKANWNCETCAYHMDHNSYKPDVNDKIMRAYGMDPENVEDRKRVIFWDDSESNIKHITTSGEVHPVYIPRLNGGTDPDAGGCGITDVLIEEGWQKVGWVNESSSENTQSESSASLSSSESSSQTAESSSQNTMSEDSSEDTFIGGSSADESSVGESSIDAEYSSEAPVSIMLPFTETDQRHWVNHISSDQPLALYSVTGVQLFNGIISSHQPLPLSAGLVVAVQGNKRSLFVIR
ncbi:MAG: hypothetical protein OCD01_04370 [Fibrobacterales bacterium]